MLKFLIGLLFVIAWAGLAGGVMAGIVTAIYEYGVNSVSGGLAMWHGALATSYMWLAGIISLFLAIIIKVIDDA